MSFTVSPRKPPMSADALAVARGASIISMLQALPDLGLKKIGAELVGACPRCGGTDRFAINTRLGRFNCRGCGAKGGDGLALVMHVRGLNPRDGADFREAVEAVIGGSADDARPLPDPVPIAKPKPDDEAAREAFILRMAEKTIRGIVPLIGTPGEAYLRDVRKINTAKIVDVLSVTTAIGWHPECLFRQDGHRLDGRRVPCIVAVMTDPLTGEPTGGISRTSIYECQKIGKAKGLGPAGIVRLTPDEEVTTGLHIAEGLETALDAMSRDLRPMWSCGSTSIMAKLPVVGGIECLTILADHDENGAGERAALELAQRWREAGREVLAVAPAAPGDFNDIAMRGVL
jgi:putative DNA primase/helicase